MVLQGADPSLHVPPSALDFWATYTRLQASIRELADKNFQLLREYPSHPSLRFPKVGNFWSARVGCEYRAIAIEIEYGLLWTWIGTHDQYERLIVN